MKLLIFFLIIPVQLVWQLHDGHGFDSREKNSKIFYSTKWKFGFVRHKNKKNFWIWTYRIKVMNYYIYNKFRKLMHCTTYNKCYYWWKIMFISKKKISLTYKYLYDISNQKRWYSGQSVFPCVEDILWRVLRHLEVGLPYEPTTPG